MMEELSRPSRAAADARRRSRAAGAATAAASTTTASRVAALGVDQRRLELGVQLGSAARTPSVVALVPAAIKSKGTLTVASDASYAPNEFIALRRAHGHRDGRRPDARRSARSMGLKVNVVNATFDDDHPRPGRRQVRHRRLVVHRHQGAREDRRLRRLLQRRRVVLHQGLGRHDRSTASPTCAARRSPSRRARPRRPTPPRRARSARRPASPRSPCSRSRTRTAPTWRSSSGRAQLGFADSPVAAYQVKKSNGQFKLVGAAYAHGAVRHRGAEEQRPRRRPSWPRSRC